MPCPGCNATTFDQYLKPLGSDVPDVCPVCGSTDFTERLDVEMNIKRMWPDKEPSAPQRGWWPCMDEWHENACNHKWHDEEWRRVTPKEEVERIDKLMKDIFGVDT